MTLSDQHATFDAVSEATFDAVSEATFDAVSEATFDAVSEATFDAERSVDIAFGGPVASNSVQ